MYVYVYKKYIAANNLKLKASIGLTLKSIVLIQIFFFKYIFVNKYNH